MTKLNFIANSLFGICLVIFFILAFYRLWIPAIIALAAGYGVFFLALFLKRFKTGGIRHPRARNMRN